MAGPNLHRHIGIVMPAYNEEHMVARMVAQIRALGYPVIVVDDGSSDATPAQAEAAGAAVISMPLHAGAWGATQAGLRHALRLGWDTIVTMDADGQHPVETVPALLAAAKHADVVIGACPRRASKLRLVAWGLFRALSGLRVEDITSGLRVYNRRAACQTLSAKGVLADYQDVAILLLLQSSGMHIEELSVAMRSREDGKSRIFSSWGRVALYMISTILLSSARRSTTKVCRDAA